MIALMLALALLAQATSAPPKPAADPIPGLLGMPGTAKTAPSDPIPGVPGTAAVKPKHDTVKNAIGNVKAVTAEPPKPKTCVPTPADPCRPT